MKRKVIKFIFLSCMFFLAGCFDSRIEEQSRTYSHNVDFSNLSYFARICDYTYVSGTIDEKKLEEIKSFDRIDLPKYSGLILTKKNDSLKTQEVFIRGTANYKNIFLDLDVYKKRDPVLNAELHAGFRRMSLEAMDYYGKVADRNYKQIISGHSLGGAMAVIMAAYLKKRGYEIEKVVTFGQPKVTNKDGLSAFSHLPLVRIIDEKDLVPLLPMVGPLTSFKGRYLHTGETIIILEDGHYVFLEPIDSEKYKTSSFWLNRPELKDHHMGFYRERIEKLVGGSIEVDYNDRLYFE